MPKTKYCPHCKQHLAPRTYRRHKQFYFIDDVWEERNTNRVIVPAVNDLDETDQDINNALEYDTEWQEEVNMVSHESRELTRSIKLDPDSLSREALSRTEEVWPDTLAHDLQDDVHCDNTAAEDTGETSDHWTRGLSKWFVLFVAHWSFLHNVSNKAVEHLLKFLGIFLRIIAKVIPALNEILDSLPNTIYVLQKMTNSRKDTFTKYVVCTKCHSVRHYADSFHNGKPLTCDYVQYPRHRMRTKRMPCDNVLFKEVHTKSGKLYYPRSVYCYNSLLDNLKVLACRPGFVDLCNEWRNRDFVPGYYRDVYDGRIWRELVNNKKYLQHRGELAFMLNLDWFQPFKNCTYSVGVLYLAINNLPRRIRFKSENIIVVSIIPGPGEPNTTQLYSYVKPLVDELLQLWEPGINVREADGQQLTVKGMLMCCACDIPASRKLCGFLGHSAKLGCNKCKKQFITGVLFNSLRVK